MKTHSKTALVLLILYVILFALLAINPVNREVWFVENATVWVVLLAIIILYCFKVRFSPLSYILMALFIY